MKYNPQYLLSRQESQFPPEVYQFSPECCYFFRFFESVFESFSQVPPLNLMGLQKISAIALFLNKGFSFGDEIEIRVDSQGLLKPLLWTCFTYRISLDEILNTL